MTKTSISSLVDMLTVAIEERGEDERDEVHAMVEARSRLVDHAIMLDRPTGGTVNVHIGKEFMREDGTVDVEAVRKVVQAAKDEAEARVEMDRSYAEGTYAEKPGMFQAWKGALIFGGAIMIVVIPWAIGLGDMLRWLL